MMLLDRSTRTFVGRYSQHQKISTYGTVSITGIRRHNSSTCADSMVAISGSRSKISLHYPKQRGRSNSWPKIIYAAVLALLAGSGLIWVGTMNDGIASSSSTTTTTTTTSLSSSLMSSPLYSPAVQVQLGKPEAPAVIAHVVSLIKCSKQARVTGFLDAAAVLRHSIHQNSVHSNSSHSNNSKKSKYSYKMYAIVHEDCKEHAHSLDRLGYTALVKPSPVKVKDIAEGYLKGHVEMENCCGSAEFIKLYAYTLLEHPVTVHWDMDVAVFQPLDDLFDAIIFPSDSVPGQSARSRLELQHPERPLPTQIDAFLTRDITSSNPWEKRQGVQGGFLVARPSMSHFERYLTFIKEGNYTKGRGEGSGWSGLGYGGFQGAMAYQGAVAYFYDQLAPNTAVELDICVWNQVVADVIFRGPAKMEHYGQCREYPRVGDTFEDNTPEKGKCRDCRVLPIDQVKSAHYTACKKPWECTLPHPRHPRDKSHVHRLQELTNVTTCGLLFRKWFDLRYDFENQLQQVGGIVPSERNGKFRPEYFGGSCASTGGYIAMVPPAEDFDITRIYGM